MSLRSNIIAHFFIKGGVYLFMKLSKETSWNFKSHLPSIVHPIIKTNYYTGSPVSYIAHPNINNDSMVNQFIFELIKHGEVLADCMFIIYV